MKKNYLIIITFLIVALLMSACGNSSAQINQTKNSTQVTPTPAVSQRKSASASEFKSALNAVGYLEEDDFDTRFASIIDSDGYNSKSLYDSAKSNGIVGYMYSDNDLGEAPEMRQYLYYELNDLVLEDDGVYFDWGNIISYIVFDDEASAISNLDDAKNELNEFLPNITEETDEHYSRITAQDGDEAIIVGRVDNTWIVFMGTPDCPAYQVFDILGY